MGYEMGIGDRRIFIDDDGMVYESPHKQSRLAESLDEFNNKPPVAFAEEIAKEVNKEEPEEVAEITVEEKEDIQMPLVCKDCGFKAKTRFGLNTHIKRKHRKF